MAEPQNPNQLSVEQDSDQSIFDSLKGNANLDFQDKRDLAQIQTWIDEIKMQKYRRLYFLAFKKYFADQVTYRMQDITVELVVYDEIENFKKASDPQFNYPYESRRQ